MSTKWKRELFVRSYDWRRLPFLGAFLGNGRLGAFIDRTGAGPQDYFFCKGIREREYLAGLFWTYSSVDTTLEHENRGWRQTLDMYHGVLQTSYAHPTHPAGRSAELHTFICRDRNLIVFHCDPPSRDPLPVRLGVSFASRGGACAHHLDRSLSVSSAGEGTASFRLLSDPMRPAGDGEEARDGAQGQTADQAPFRLIDLHCVVAALVEGEAVLSQVGESFEAEVRGPATLYVLFEARENDAPDLEAAIAYVRSRGYAQIRGKHEQDWERFWNASWLQSPHLAIDRLYASSLYYIACDVGEIGRNTSCSCPFPLNGWKSSYGWDDVHMHQALLSTNHPAMTDVMVDHWEAFRSCGLGAMVLAARDPGARGVLLDYFGFEPEFCREGVSVDRYRDKRWLAPTVGLVATLSAGLAAWRQYSYTGDRKSLRKHYPLIRDIALMLKTFALQPHGDRLWIRVSQQSDESYGYAGTANPMASAATTKAFLDSASRAAAEMAEPELSEELRLASEKAELPSNGWVYLPFAGTDDASSDALLTFFPAMITGEKAVAARTLDYYKGRCMGVMGGVDAQAWVKDRAVFPWVHFRALAGEAMLGRHRQAADLLEQAMRHDCYEWDWGWLPEMIHRNGCPNVPLLTPHGMFVSAVNAMYLQEEGGVVKVFAGVTDDWLRAPLGFRLRTAPGAVVSAEWAPELGMELVVEAARLFVMRIRKPDFIKAMVHEGNELPEVEGYCCLEIPAGGSRRSLRFG